MSDDFVYFEQLLDENDDILENYLITIFQFEKLVIGKGTAEYTCYCLDEYGEPIVDINDFMDFGKNCTLAEYEQLFKNGIGGVNQITYLMDYINYLQSNGKEPKP